MQNEIPELDTKGLQQFGFILGGIFILGFGLFLPWMWGWKSLPNYLWVSLGGGIVIWALLLPNSLRSLYVNWMRVAMVIGHVVNSVILALVFFMVITPMALMMKVLGKDPMSRKLDKNIKSYRVNSKILNKNHFERPY